ncbi:lysine--tRNA ligase [Candidatus Woesebacteria bacterium]|nr:lysine--tRNA ligase [Candidatus Woesebacteria bacterium]
MQEKQSAHWLDQLVENILDWQKNHEIKQLHIDDMKTPSGRVHVGALRGVILHDLVAKALRKRTDQNIVSTYVFNNMDNMDSLPGYLPGGYQEYMGHSLYKIPTPPLDQGGISFDQADESEKHRFAQAKNFAEFYAFDFIDAFTTLGATPEIVWSNELYESGKMNDIIRTALDSVNEMRNIYKEIADYKLPDKWYPFQVQCEQCGCCGSTLVTNWDGENVTYECQPNKVEWAKGCGHTNTISPFNGAGKLLWKVDWPAHWQVMGVTVEGAGKDHTSAGGSRDMANAMCERVFHNTPPFDIPYEWILVRGAKMSSSKGVGMSAKDFVQIMPPSVGRYLFTSHHFNQVIDFDPSTLAIPDLFDEYDEGARIFWRQEEGDSRNGRSFELAQAGQLPEPHFLPRFRDVVQWLQFPNVNLIEHFSSVKGTSLSTLEEEVLAERVKYARRWLETTAPESVKFSPSATLPEGVRALTSEQRTYLHQLLELIESHPNWSPDELQQALFELAKSTIGTKLAFAAIYTAIIGKSSGPKAAWLLDSLEKEFLRQRLTEASLQSTSLNTNLIPDLDDASLFSISSTMSQTYPDTCVGIAIIKGVSIKPSSAELDVAVEETAASVTTTTEQINEFPELLAYRAMYKKMGVDWHSRRPSPEAILRRMAQGKGFPRVNTCVDAYNLAVVKNRVSVGAFDLTKFAFPTVLDISKGTESIHLLGNEEAKSIEAGEVFYADQNGPYNLDFNYRDAIRTAATPESTDLLINVDGIGPITRAQVEHTLQEAVDLITRFCGGTVTTIGIVEAKKA